MKTILPKKATVEQPTATNDEALQQLLADPTIPQFGSSNLYNAPSALGMGIGFNQNIGAQFYQPRPYPTAAGPNAAQNAEILAGLNKDSFDWLNRRWRPAMGWMYMVVCIFDFIIFPIMFAVLQATEARSAYDPFRQMHQMAQWQPVTLMGAGLFHMAMGAVLGIAAYGRTKEKIEGVNRN